MTTTTRQLPPFDFDRLVENFDRDLDNVRYYLASGNIGRASALITNTADTVEAAKLAGHDIGWGLALELWERQQAFKTAHARHGMLRNAVKKLALAQQGRIECEPPDNRGYKGCGGAGVRLYLDAATGDVTEETCRRCGGAGWIERRAEARDLLERTTREYGSLANATQLIFTELRANPFYTASERVDRSTGEILPPVSGDAGDDVPF